MNVLKSPNKIRNIIKLFSRINFTFLVLLLPIMITFVNSGCDQIVESRSSEDSYVKVVNNRNSFLELEFAIENYRIQNIEEDGEIYSDLVFNGGVRLNQKGYADLPFLNASVQLPITGEVDYEIIDVQYEDIPLLHPFLPAKGTIYRNQNPADIKRSIAPESIRAEFFPNEIVNLEDPYIFRDTRGVNIYANSFRYDAENKILRVYTKLTVALNIIKDDQARNAMTALPETIVREMDPIYKSLFINYGAKNNDSDISSRFNNEISEFGEILVLHTSRDAQAIQPYVTWKRQMGYKVHTKQVATGTNVKSIIQDEYNKNTKLLYVQLVGDWADIKADTGGGEGRPMDPMLGCVKGTDIYADLIIGRFSAENSEHVTTQVNKAIDYEKNPDKSGTWYKKTLGLGSAEGPGDDGEIDFKHLQIIYDNKLKPFTYDQAYMYTDGDSSSKTSSAINSGVGLINYVGHGDVTIWYTTNFSNTNINSLSNGKKLPVIISVACVNGWFDHDKECFAEKWLRKTNGGAVAALMSTIYQPWQPPMRGQDYMNDLLTGGYNYSGKPGSGISTNAGRTTFGSIAFNGMVLMFSEKSKTEDRQTIETWTIFGDASVQVRTDTPKAISISNKSIASGQAFTTKVTSNGKAVQGARVAISQGENVFSAVTDSSGSVTISHTLKSGSANVVVTGFNLDTIFETVSLGGGDTSNNAPDANFTYSTNQLIIVFSDKSTDSENNISSWKWTFGDGKSSTEKNPSHTYSQGGSFSVKLTVTDEGGLTDSITKTVKVTQGNDGEGNYLTVNSGSGSGTYAPGEIVTIEADDELEGKTFDKWVVNSGYAKIADINSSKTTLTMPSKNVSITATYKDNDTNIGCGSLFSNASKDEEDEE